MGLLDAVSSAAGIGSMVPGMELLGVVSQGIGLAKSLFDKGDVQGTQDVLKFVNDILSKMENPQQQGAAAGQASEPQPFSSPQSGGNEPWSATATVTMMITPRQEQSQAQPVSYGTLPIVDGSAQQDQSITNQASPRIDGASRGRVLSPGSGEWQQVMAAMQQNPNVRYNADTQRFTMNMSDGSQRDVCSLQDVQSAGYSRANPSAVSAVGTLLNEKVRNAENSSASSITNEVANQAASGTAADGGSSAGDVSAGDLSHLIEELLKKLQQFEKAAKMMGPGSMDLTARLSA